MDGSAFDDLSRVFAISRSRRRFVGLLSALPLSGWIVSAREASVEAAGRRQRRKKRHHHQQGDEKDNRTGKRKGKARGKRTCLPEPSTLTCAGRCGTITNTCDQAVDCGSCACNPACPQCQRCDATTGQCLPIADGTACNDGDACTQTDTCQNGACVGSNPLVCPPIDHCHDAGVCDAETGLCSNPPAYPDGTACGTGGQCDDGRCFVSFPNCSTCGGHLALARNSNFISFCHNNVNVCAGQTCTQTGECPDGQWCAVLAGCGDRCVTGCPA